jgi:ABC-type phosphate/phosphonate transport system substrate-binding protein
MDNLVRKCMLSIILAAMLGWSSVSASAANADSNKAEGSKSSKPYTFAVIPYYTPEKIWSLFTPFVKYLSAETTQTWELKLYTNHDELIDDLCDGKVSVALLGPIPLGRAYNRCGVQPFLVALSQNGTPSYHSVMATIDRDVKDLSGLKGRKVALFKGSTAAHILPVKMLNNAGVTLKEVKPVFLESQDRIVAALLSGEVTAAGLKESLFRKISDQNVRMLATSEEVPNFTLSALPSFPEKTREKVATSLLRLKPRTNSRDALTVKGWDSEICNGFVRPPKNLLPSVLNLYSTYWEVTNEN